MKVVKPEDVVKGLNTWANPEHLALEVTGPEERLVLRRLSVAGFEVLGDILPGLQPAVPESPEN